MMLIKYLYLVPVVDVQLWFPFISYSCNFPSFFFPLISALLWSSAICAFCYPVFVAVFAPLPLSSVRPSISPSLSSICLSLPLSTLSLYVCLPYTFPPSIHPLSLPPPSVRLSLPSLSLPPSPPFSLPLFTTSLSLSLSLHSLPAPFLPPWIPQLRHHPSLHFLPSLRTSLPPILFLPPSLPLSVSPCTLSVGGPVNTYMGDFVETTSDVLSVWFRTSPSSPGHQGFALSFRAFERVSPGQPCTVREDLLCDQYRYVNLQVQVTRGSPSALEPLRGSLQDSRVLWGKTSSVTSTGT